MIWPARRQPDIPDTPPAVMLRGARVLVRPPAPGDYAAWSEVRGANRAALEPLEPAWPDDCLSSDFFNRRLKRQARDWKYDFAYSFLIFLDGRLIGGINLNHIARGAAQSASLGYWLDKDHQGKGYMQESLALVADYAFTTLNLHRLNAACLPYNKKSMAVLRALGFAEEGFAKAYYRIHGRWEDHVLFGRVRPEESHPMSLRPEEA